MTREIHADVTTASQQAVIRPVLMFDGDFSSGHVRYHSGVGTISYGGYDYTGAGALGRISSIDENVELSASGIKVSLSGLPGDVISTALGEHYQGRRAVVYIAMLDADHQVIADPVIIFQGRMDNMNITLGAEASVELSIENPLRDWERPRERRYNNADQQATYPTDKGLEFIEQAVEKEIYWGGEAPKAS
jgi:hypothetical protein